MYIYNLEMNYFNAVTVLHTITWATSGIFMIHFGTRYTNMQFALLYHVKREPFDNRQPSPTANVSGALMFTVIWVHRAFLKIAQTKRNC
jgi:hypothetical protein